MSSKSCLFVSSFVVLLLAITPFNSFAGAGFIETYFADVSTGPMPLHETDSVGEDYYYHVQDFNVSESGTYIMQVTGHTGEYDDSYLLLYEDSFDNSATNYLTHNDDADRRIWSLPSSYYSLLQEPLVSGTTYSLVTTTYDPDQLAGFDISISGIGLITLIDSIIEVEEGVGELHGSVPMVAFSLIDSFNVTASKRMLRLRQSGHEAFALKDPLDGLMLASAGDVTNLGPITGNEQPSRNVWAKIYGIDGDVDSDGTVAGYDYQVAGVAMGIDYKACQNAYLGFMFGIGDADAETDLSDDFDVRSYQLGVYSTYENGPYYLDGILTYAFSDYETSRVTATGTASSDYDGNEWGVALEAGKVVDNNGLIFEPFIGAQYIYVDQDSFNESGAGDNNMSIESRDDYSMQVKAGARVSKIYQKENSIFVPEFKLSYKKEFGDDQDTVTANFVNTPAPSSFVVKGLEHDDDMFEIGIGCRFISGNNIIFDVDLSTELNDDEEAYIASIGFKKMW